MLIGSSFIEAQCLNTFMILPIEPETAVQDLALLSSDTQAATSTIGNRFS